jgi:aminopeptidase N
MNTVDTTLSTVGTTTSTTTPSTSTSSSRLPIVIVPNHYEITYSRIDLDPYLTTDDYTFEGIVSISGTSVVNDLLSKIIVHTKEIQLTHATFCKLSTDNDNASEAVTTEEFNYSIKDETCEICFSQQSTTNDSKNQFFQLIKDTEYILTLKFIGILNNQMRGLYRSTYVGIDNTTKKLIATTQFEPTDARRAFPCIDEPAMKATFQLIISIPTNVQCISNTTIESIHTKISNNGDKNNINNNTTTTGSKQDDIIKTITFHKTPIMSTYLVALIIGEFDSISQISSTNNNTTNKNSIITTTVYTTPGKAQYGQFCLNTAVQCLNLYQDLYGISYPLTKSDLIAIPDFAAGAMENW